MCVNYVSGLCLGCVNCVSDFSLVVFGSVNRYHLSIYLFVMFSLAGLGITMCQYKQLCRHMVNVWRVDVPSYLGENHGYKE